jgi:hypothetical protein
VIPKAEGAEVIDFSSGGSVAFLGELFFAMKSGQWPPNLNLAFHGSLWLCVCVSVC